MTIVIRIQNLKCCALQVVLKLVINLLFPLEPENSSNHYKTNRYTNKINNWWVMRCDLNNFQN